MSVRTLCLAFLNFSDATGYEIRKATTEGEFRYLSEASFGSIYPALGQLETEGAIRAVAEESGKPGRKTYTITPKGQEELRQALTAPPRQDVIRSPFLLTAVCAEILGVRVVRRAIDIQLGRLQADAAALETVASNNSGTPIAWAANLGRAAIAAKIDFIEKNRQTLEDAGRNAQANKAIAAE